MVEEAFAKAWELPTTPSVTTGLLEAEATKSFPEPQTIEAGKWLGLIHHPSIVIILGGRGKGKSALGY